MDTLRNALMGLGAVTALAGLIYLATFIGVLLFGRPY